MHTRSILLLSLLVTTSFCTNKIIYLVSPPRSLSVAFLRMMHARGDFSIMHEPSQPVFNRMHSPDIVQNYFRKNSFQSFYEVKTAILQEVEKHNVFVKEISFAVEDFHLNDAELMKNPHVYFVFLIRNPHHTIISFYKKVAPIFDQIAYQISDLIGYKSLYSIFKAAKQHAAQAPYIIYTEDLYNNPQETIKRFCQHIGIAFKPESLHWDNLGEHFDGQAWHEAKHKELIHYWHGDAIKSTGFEKPTSY